MISSDFTYCVPEVCTSFFASLASKLASSEEISRNFTSFLLSKLLWVGVCLLFVVVEIGLRLEQLTKKVVTANAAKIILDILVPFSDVRLWKARPERKSQMYNCFPNPSILNDKSLK